MNKRDELQARFTKELLEAKFGGLMMVAPRVGKSKIVIDAIKENLNLRNYDYSNGFRIPVVIAMPIRVIETSWKREFDRWFPDHASKIEVKYILHTHIDKVQTSFMIIDEIQEVFASKSKLKRLDIAFRNKTKVLGLSGYMSSLSRDRARRANMKVISEYPVEVAVDDGIISDFRVILRGVDLDEEYNIPVNDWMTSEKKAYQYWDKKVIEAELTNKDATYLIGKRANALFNFPKKLEVVKQFVEAMSEQRLLIFTARTSIADSICDSYHSKNAKLNNLKRFQMGEIDKLAVCKTVSMGITIPNLKVGIFHQLDSNAEKHLQKVLRLCNLEDASQKALVYIFYYKNTRDEKWAKAACSGIPKRFIIE